MSALNAIDVMLAHEHDQRTVLGAYLNELTDAISDAALYLPFVFGGLCLWFGLIGVLPDRIIWLMPFVVLVIIFNIINRIRSGLVEVSNSQQGVNNGPKPRAKIGY
jgi:CDP-diacylglycerol--glycerol-3-phosphate 3-phosphatidyltransferase